MAKRKHKKEVEAPESAVAVPVNLPTFQVQVTSNRVCGDVVLNCTHVWEVQAVDENDAVKNFYTGKLVTWKKN